MDVSAWIAFGALLVTVIGALLKVASSLSQKTAKIDQLETSVNELKDSDKTNSEADEARAVALHNRINNLQQKVGELDAAAEAIQTDLNRRLASLDAAANGLTDSLLTQREMQSTIGQMKTEIERLRDRTESLNREMGEVRTQAAYNRDDHRSQG